MTAGFVGLIAVTLGLIAGWLLRSEQVWDLQRRNEILLSDLDCAVHDIGVMIGRQNHPAGRASVTKLRQVKP